MHARYLARSGENGLEESLARAAMQGRTDDARFSERERAALRYSDLMWHDHKAMPDDFWDELMRLFTPREFTELGMTVAMCIGMGQFNAMLGLAATDEMVKAVAEAGGA
jgi:alkylhydroperoxidase family enzyme